MIPALMPVRLKLVAVIPLGACTRIGRELYADEPLVATALLPSCPELLSPHAQTWPWSSKAKEKAFPALIYVNRFTPVGLGI